MFRRDVKALDDIMLHCLRNNGLETPLRQRRLIESWDEVAGKAISRCTGEKFIKNQTLFVKVLNPALRADLSMMRGELLAKLTAVAGSGIVTEIRFY